MLGNIQKIKSFKLEIKTMLYKNKHLYNFLNILLVTNIQKQNHEKHFFQVKRIESHKKGDKNGTPGVKKKKIITILFTHLQKILSLLRKCMQINTVCVVISLGINKVFIYIYINACACHVINISQQLVGGVHHSAHEQNGSCWKNKQKLSFRLESTHTK